MSAPSKFDHMSFQWKPTYKYLVKVNSTKEFPLEVKQRFLNTFSREISTMESDGEKELQNLAEMNVQQRSSNLEIYLTMTQNCGSFELERVAEDCLVRSMGRKLHGGMLDYFVEIKVIPELRAGC